MTTYQFLLHAPRPYFAEIPYALWGEVNYDSEGDCRRPTDQEWTSLELTHRDTRQRVVVLGAGNEFSAESQDAELAARTASYLLERSSGTALGADPRQQAGSWSYAEAYARTARVRAEFPRPELKPFDSHLFWGSWKWVGWFATDFTWVGRWIMNSVLTRDPRAVCLCIDWLKAPPVHPDQSAALRYALQTLTGKSYATDREWIQWYEGGLFRIPGHKLYPEPDFEAWLAELKNSQN